MPSTTIAPEMTHYLQLLIICVVIITCSSLIKFYILGENGNLWKIVAFGLSNVLLYSAANLVMALVYATFIPQSWINNMKQIKLAAM